MHTVDKILGSFTDLLLGVDALERHGCQGVVDFNSPRLSKCLVGSGCSFMRPPFYKCNKFSPTLFLQRFTLHFKESMMLGKKIVCTAHF